MQVFLACRNSEVLGVYDTEEKAKACLDHDMCDPDEWQSLDTTGPFERDAGYTVVYLNEHEDRDYRTYLYIRRMSVQ